MEQMVKIYTQKNRYNSVLREVQKDSEFLLKQGWYILQTESSIAEWPSDGIRQQVMVVYRRKA